MKKVTLQWATPNIDDEIMFQARVSNPLGQDSGKPGLIAYCMREGHVSPFDMANFCVQIDTTRDIGRQILRHKSFFFQEFSQRYADVSLLPEAEVREARLQDTKNRQNSIEIDDYALQQSWTASQITIWKFATEAYQRALAQGIAKEVARSVLPEGLTPSRLYMNGTIRSWIFYLKQRLHPSTQKEHRQVALEALAIFRQVAPITAEAFFPAAEYPV